MNTKNSSTEPSYWRVAVVEDHLLQRRRTEELLGAQPGLDVVFSCETTPQLMAWLAATTVRTRPHLVVLDLMVERGPHAKPEQVEAMVQAGIRVLVLSAMASPALVRDILRAGVHGILSKRDSEENILSAVWAVLGRERWITPELASVIATDPDRPALSDQEERVVLLYAAGLTLSAVAEVVGVQPGTAKKYLERVKKKYAALGRPVRTKLDLSREVARDRYPASETDLT